MSVGQNRNFFQFTSSQVEWNDSVSYLLLICNFCDMEVQFVDVSGFLCIKSDDSAHLIFLFFLNFYLNIVLEYHTSNCNGKTLWDTTN